MFPWLREVALAVAALWLVLELAGRGRRAVPVVALGALLVLLAWRGWQIQFVPLTNKYESFVGFSATLLGVGAVRHGAIGRPGRVVMAALATAFLAATLAFDTALHYPSPLLVTVWYPAHVPLSFVGYALWFAAAADGLDHVLGVTDASELRVRQEWNVRWGLAFFSLAMIFGSIWGIVSWGAYFLWDAKILWSLASWVYFATFAHLRYWPAPPARWRVALGALGFVLVLGTYVGTSFMTGSIHAF